MNKSLNSKNTNSKWFWYFLLFGATLFLFLHIFFVTEIGRLGKSKILLMQKLNARENLLEDSKANLQKYLSEERIVKFAKDSLGLVKPESSIDVIKVSKKQVIQINKIVNKKYE